jgi:hypothetical protein
MRAGRGCQFEGRPRARRRGEREYQHRRMHQNAVEKPFDFTIYVTNPSCGGYNRMRSTNLVTERDPPAKPLPLGM